MRQTARRCVLLSVACVLMPSGIAAVQTPGPGRGVARSTSVARQERSGGSSVPCAVPLRWRLAGIDTRFGLSRADAEAALRDAFGLWQTDVGGTLFAADEVGHPISFEFDERQASAQRRRAERDAASVIGGELETMRASFEEHQALHRREGTAYEDAVAAYGVRTRTLNEEIASWNQRRDMPDSVRTRLGGERDILADHRRNLDRRWEGIEEGNEALSAESRRLNRQVEEYNQAQERLDRVPIGREQAGRYDEEVTTRDGQVEDIRRQIRVFRYDSARDLVIILAHELGHALGLGHANVPGAVMSEVSTFEENHATPRLHPRDVEMLDAICPGLRSESSLRARSGPSRAS